jgi:hypothetical protein
MLIEEVDVKYIQHIEPTDISVKGIRKMIKEL